MINYKDFQIKSGLVVGPSNTRVFDPQANLSALSISSSGTILSAGVDILDLIPDSVYLPTSSNWDNVYTTVSANSANWSSGNTYLPASSDWSSTYTTVSSNSADWENTYLIVRDSRDTWDAVYSTVSSNSASWSSGSGSSTGEVTYIVAPNSYTTITTAGYGTGINFSWTRSLFTYTLQFDTPQTDANYIVLTDNEGRDDVFMSVTNKTVSGFTIQSFDDDGDVLRPEPTVVMVFGSTPTVAITAGGGGSDLTGAGTTPVIAPFAFGFVNDTTAASGTGISWSNWDSSNNALQFAFDTEQPDTNYAVITDSETFDDFFVGVTNKTVSGFRAEFYDNSQGRTPSDFSPFTFVIYGSTPTHQAGVIADQDLRTIISTNSADWDLGATSWTTITANSASWLGGAGSGAGAAGAFVTNITCGTDASRVNGITQTHEDSDEIAVDSQVPLVSALVDTPTVRIHTQWEGSASEWTGSPYISGSAVSRTNTTAIGGAYARRFEGYVDLDLTPYRGSTVSVPYTYDGTNKTIDIEVAGLGPEVIDFQVTSTPQYGQDHYKDGDDVTFVVGFNTADVSSINLAGGDNYATDTVSNLSMTSMNGVSATFTTTVRTTLNTKTARPFRFTAKNSLGTAGVTYTSTDTIDVLSGPVITNMSVGAYPGTQTELKKNDNVSITFEFDTNNVDQVTTGNTSSLGVNSRSMSVVSLSGSASFTVGNSTISNNSGGELHGFTAHAIKTSHHNQSGPVVDSAVDFSQTLRINNQGATFSSAAVTYPVTQTALKDSESATVNCVVSNQGTNATYAYSSPLNQLTVAAPGSYDPSGDKTVSRIAGGYNVSDNNYRIDVTRAENDKTTVFQSVVNIANIAPVIRVYSNSTSNSQGPRMRSGSTDNTSLQNYNIRMTSDQQLNVLPVMNAPHGTMTGFSGGLNSGVFNATMSVSDSDVKGVHSYIGLVAKNIANKEQTVVDTSSNSSGDYTFGGFVSRTISMVPFNNQVQINVLWSDYSKLTLSWSKYPNSTFTTKPAGTVGNFPDPSTIYWSVVDQTISNTGTTPITIQILDDSRTSNNSATTTITVEEIQ